MILELNGIDQNNSDMRLRVSVPDDHRDAIDQIVKCRVIAKPAFEIKTPMRELGSVPLAVATKDRRFPRYVGFVFALILCVLSFIFVFRDGFTGIPEFDQSIFLGFIISPSVKAFRWRPVTQIGQPLVRLSGRASILRLFVLLSAAVALYFLVRRFGLNSTWFAYGSGIAFGWALAAAITNVAWTQLDFRENGIILQGRGFSWSEVRVQKWNAKTNGQLVLRCRWRRVIATVPSEQRDAVNAVLREKVCPASEQPIRNAVEAENC
jgi:hypothetical protein